LLQTLLSLPQLVSQLLHSPLLLRLPLLLMLSILLLPMLLRLPTVLSPVLPLPTQLVPLVLLLPRPGRSRTPTGQTKL
jgi:hypothetical protein